MHACPCFLTTFFSYPPWPSVNSLRPLFTYRYSGCEPCASRTALCPRWLECVTCPLRFSVCCLARSLDPRGKGVFVFGVHKKKQDPAFKNVSRVRRLPAVGVRSNPLTPCRGSWVYYTGGAVARARSYRSRGSFYLAPKKRTWALSRRIKDKKVYHTIPLHAL